MAEFISVLVQQDGVSIMFANVGRCGVILLLLLAVLMVNFGQLLFVQCNKYNLGSLCCNVSKTSRVSSPKVALLKERS